MALDEATFPDLGLTGFFQTLGMLSDAEVQAFVVTVREREGLQLADDRETLDCNLKAHQLDDFAEEAYPVALEFWLRTLSKDLEGAELPQDWKSMAQALNMDGPGQAVGIMLRWFGRGVGQVAREGAQVISRYIVGGFMVVPPPTGL